MMNKIKKIVSSTPFSIAMIFTLAGAVLYFTLKDDYQSVLAALKQVNVLWFVGILAIMVFERFILGWQLANECRLTHPKYTNFQGFINAYVAGLFNNITPGASGGQVAQGFIFKKQGIPVSNSLGVLWLDFIVYQSTMCIFVLILIICKFSYFLNNYPTYLLLACGGFGIAAVIIICLWLLALYPNFYMWLSTTGIDIGVKLHVIKNREETVRKLDDALMNFSKEIVVLRSHKSLIVKLVIGNVARLAIYYSIPFLTACALGYATTPKMWFDMMALASFVAMVNAFLPMPGSAGGTEVMFILLFCTELIGFTKVQATTVMILWRFATFYQVLLVGSIVFIIAKMQKDVPIDNKHVATTYTAEALEQLRKEVEDKQRELDAAKAKLEAAMKEDEGLNAHSTV